MQSVAERQFGPIRVVLVHADIADIHADVLVNAANNQLHMGGGVAAALRARGGIAIHQEAIQHAPASIGSVVRTHAGNLDARFVYHAVVIDYDVSKGTAASDVGAAMRNIVAQAESDGIHTLALPLFGAGVGGLSVETSIRTILDALEETGRRFPHDLSVSIAVRDQEEVECALREVNAYRNVSERQRDEADAANEFLKRYLGEQDR